MLYCGNAQYCFWLICAVLLLLYEVLFFNVAMLLAVTDRSVVASWEMLWYTVSLCFWL